MVESKIDLNKLPRHIAIIMDGNGRWAKKQGKPRVFGHKNGVASVREAVEAAAELGIEYLTLYAFSTENWNRPKLEVMALMKLLVTAINNEKKTLNKNNIRLITIGDTEALPPKAVAKLNEVIKKTEGNTRMTLVLALSYSAKWEILNATRQLAEKVKNKELSVADIDESTFVKHLCTSNIPDPELLIRTSGENRVSNFLLWQIA